MKKSNLFSNEYIAGMVLLFSGIYLQSEGRSLSATLFSFASIVLFVIDLFKKVSYVQKLRQEIKVKAREESKNKK